MTTVRGQAKARIGPGDEAFLDLWDEAGKRETLDVEGMQEV
jgi:hypothetical protein